MFTHLRARMGIASSSRLPLYIHSLAARDHAMPIERVRFRRPIFRPRILIGRTLTAIAFYGLFTHLVLSPLDKLEEELEKNLDEQARKELDEDSLFIPFPGTIRQVQPRPYRGSDPEWQEYVKFSRDPVLGKKVRDELAAYIRNVCEKSPVITMRCGKTINLRRYWLDVDFPPSPPPEFERSGVEIANDYVAWTTMPVDSLTVFRIRQALWPSAVTQSFWSFTKALFTQDTSGIAERLGVPTKPQPSFEEMLAKHAKRPIAELGKSEQSSKDAASPTATTSNTFGQSKHTNANLPIEKTSDSLENSLDKTNTQTTDPNAIKMKVHLLNAYVAFRQKLTQTWRPAPSYPPRGSILVSGLIELDSARAWIVIDVKAAWDPKAKAFDQRSMQLVVRRLQMKKQGPLRGR